jgi:hypothetical protein
VLALARCHARRWCRRNDAGIKLEEALVKRAPLFFAGGRNPNQEETDASTPPRRFAFQGGSVLSIAPALDAS